MSGLLQDFEWWAATAVGALNNSELALLKNVSGVVLVGDGLLLAGVVAASEGSAVEHSLFNWMQLVYGLARLMAVFAGALFWVILARSADKLVALTAITRIDGDEATVNAE